MALLELDKISKRFGAVEALSEISFEMEASEAIGLIGDNGAGKSTLVKILSGVHAPTTGTVRLDGEEVRFGSPLDARAAGIEIIHQDLALCEDLDIASNIFLGRELRRGPLRLLDRPAMVRKAQSIMQELGTDVPPRREVSALSGGERQLVAVARALEFGPRVLLLDEPTAALSTEKIRVMLGLVEKLKQRGVAIILISHRFTDVLHLCDRVLVTRQGRIAGSIVPGDRPADETITEMHDMMTGVAA
jgi:simple sugar transport system ATP-binding protein